MKSKFNLKRTIQNISLGVLGGLSMGGMIASPSYATGGAAPATGADYQDIIDTSTAAVTALGGLAMLAFGAAIAPFIGRITMLSISQVFKSM